MISLLRAFDLSCLQKRIRSSEKLMCIVDLSKLLKQRPKTLDHLPRTNLLTGFLFSRVFVEFCEMRLLM